jgi:hypothetical protein
VQQQQLWQHVQQAQQQQLWQHVQQAQQQQRAVARSEVSQPTEERFDVYALHLGAGIEVGAFALQYKQDFQAVINNPPHRDHSIFQVGQGTLAKGGSGACCAAKGSSGAVPAGAVGVKPQAFGTGVIYMGGCMELSGESLCCAASCHAVQLVVSSDDQDMLNPETDEEANPRYMIVYR